MNVILRQEGIDQVLYFGFFTRDPGEVHHLVSLVQTVKKSFALSFLFMAERQVLRFAPGSQ